MKRILTISTVIGTLLAGAGGIALAQAPGGPGGAGGPRGPGMHPHAAAFHHEGRGGWGMFGEHLDGTLAFFKTELKITPQQEPQWQKVEAAVRAGAAKMQEMRPPRPQRGPGDQPPPPPPHRTALDRMNEMETRSATSAEVMHNIRVAFEPLYASMSDDQKKTADNLLRHRGGRRH